MPSKPETEKSIEQSVVYYAVAEGVLVFKFTPVGQRGWPDRLFFYNGRALFIEFKRPGKKPTKLQERRLAQLEALRIPARWCNSVVEGMRMINDFRRGFIDANKL